MERKKLALTIEWSQTAVTQKTDVDVTVTQQNFDLFEDDPTGETLEDVHVGEKSLANSVLYNTDWTVETLIRQVVKGTIDLNPSFQRRDAWGVVRKSQFIESILLNFPVPPLTLAEKSNTKTFIVVDGKQRLTTLAQFFGLLKSSDKNKFKLQGLQELEQLNGVTCEDIERRYPDMYLRLENYSMRTNVIRGWSSDDVLYSIFLRLNSGSVKLSAQELRQALHPGPFSDFLLNYSEDSHALRSIFPGSEPDFRMRDLELLVRYFGFHVHLEAYRGDLKRFLDYTVSRINDDWHLVKNEISRIAERFESVHQVVAKVFSNENVYRKWNGDNWESRLNRAVFDVMTFYPRDEAQIEAFATKGDDLVESFKRLCENNYDFRDAIETTTKSIDAVADRLGFWGEILADRDIIAKPVYIDEDDRLRYDGQVNIF